MVAFARTSYETNCRFWVNSAVEETIRWYVTKPDAPVLGSPSQIRPLRSCYFPWADSPNGIGEVYGAEQKWIFNPTVELLRFDHVCGTREDFEVGGRRDDTPPPVKYDRNGIPTCCQPPVIADGGAVGTGTATVNVVGPTFAADYSWTALAGFCLLNTTIPNLEWSGMSGSLGGPIILTSPPNGGQGFWKLVWFVGLDWGEYRHDSSYSGFGVAAFNLHSATSGFFPASGTLGSIP